ncbi:DUF1016 domain-containing protein [Granulosicoccus sp.]|nr:DUF1016 domain-containing protein [Granulosicoccus sp.]
MSETTEELKAGKSKPEHLGPLSFYLSAVDDAYSGDCEYP